ncbi:hypothetical protein ACFQY5_17780 [Paeniroseomonas aquatica]|uniref:hypothetical protein n=1 Tax=Paeniroseomonas aquatica TaxID=373043 RepID=UPI0036073A20
MSFYSNLRNVGSAGNQNLRTRLGWDEDFYWRVQGRLIEEGKIVAGRGKGGSVRFTEAQAAASGTPVEGPNLTILADASELVEAYGRERDLYAPLKRAIEQKWINKFGFDDVLVDETHSRGSRDTGGTFTRPDITAAGVKRYVYLPKRLEIVTFEVKSAEAVSIMGVLEAIAHREAAHRSYVLYAVSRALFDATIEAERIVELAQKYGIGVVLVERPAAVESWEILLDAVRHEPDPARLDRFLGDLPSEAMKKHLSKWKE